MTSKAVISQLEVNERRLKGIYDQLESGTLKKAITEAEKVLKKNPSLLPARVLKALALYRSGKTPEAFSIVNEVVSNNPSDESTLSTLCYFFRESNQKNRIVDIYEEAYKQFPNREDICINLFYCHIKSFNYLSQQKIAVQLRKLNVTHMEYGMWPMIGNVLHGVYNNDLRFVKLGEAMLTKFFNSNSLLSAERIEFLIFIFEKMDKVQECYDWLCGSTLKDVVDNAQNKLLFSQCKIDLLLKLGRREEACVLQWELIVENGDNICLWRDYIDNAVQLNIEPENPHSLQSIVGKLNGSDSNRIANKVAMIHLSMALEKVDSVLLTKFGSKTDKIVEYFVQFGDRSSCFYDIYTFLAVDGFQPSDRRNILDRITKHCVSMTLSDNKAVERYNSMMALKRSVNGSADIDVQSLIDTYHAVLPLSSAFGPTEIKPCDSLIKLAVSCYFDKWLLNVRDSCPLVDSLVLLTQALKISPANYHLRLQLSHFYGLLGCLDLSIAQFNALEIKQLMWDSLGHHYIIPALSVPSFERRINFLWKNSLRKQKNKLEIEENLVTCYKLGNYGRIPELIDFYKAIDASVMSRLSETEIIYANTVLKSNSCDELFTSCGSINLPEVQSPDPELDILASMSFLKDFRDLKTSPDFMPIERCWTTADQSSSFKHIVLWITQRYLVLRAYYSCAKVTMETVVKLDILSHDKDVSFTDVQSNYYNVLVSSRRSLSDIWAQIDTVSGSYINLHNDLTGCIEPPHTMYSSFYNDLVIECIDTIVTFHDRFVRQLPSASLSDWSQTLLSPITKAIAKVLSLEMENNDVFVTMPRLIAHLTVLTEMFAVVTMNLSLLENMTKPMRPKQEMKRKNRKKVEATVDVGIEKFSEFRQLLAQTHLDTVPGSLIAIIDSVDQLIVRARLLIDTAVANKSVTGDYEERMSVLSPICDSWKTSLDEAAHLLGTKKTQLTIVREIMECPAKAAAAATEPNEM